MTRKAGPLGDSQELRASATVVVVIVALAIFVYLIHDILLPFVFAGILAYVLTPLVDWCARRTRKPRWLFASAVLLVLVIAAAAAGYIGIPAFTQEVMQVGGDLKGTVSAFMQKFIGSGTVTLLGEQINADRIGASVESGLHNWLGGKVFTLAALSFATMFGFILAWVLLGYLLFDARKISEGLFWLVPPHHRPFVRRVWRDLNPILRRYFVGVALVVLYASVVAYIGLGLILHIHHAALLAVLTGVLEVIPIVGPAASAIIAGLVAVQEAKSSWNILAYVAYAIVLRISIDEFFGPIVLGKAAYVRPALVIFCFLAGGLLFGIVGVVLAIPVALTIKTSLQELYKEENR
ncbi:MAG TPA: AI-2E family transporter [Pseudolabrys sp.]|jgi:predicted PurR-regulated permease PerM|nr:AI-2E family transporter [Pseudolabrys sp.]